MINRGFGWAQPVLDRHLLCCAGLIRLKPPFRTTKVFGSSPSHFTSTKRVAVLAAEPHCPPNLIECLDGGDCQVLDECAASGWEGILQIPDDPIKIHHPLIMAGGSSDRRSSSIDALRSELDNIQEAEILVPSRTSVTGDSTPAEGETAETRRGGARRSNSSTRRSEPVSHIRFSDDAGHRRGHPSTHLRLDTDLYPIQSRVEESQDGPSQPDASSSGLAGEPEGGESNPGRVSFAAQPVPPPRHRRLRLRGIGGEVKSVANAAEASARVSRAKDWVARQRARAKRLRRSPTGRLQTRLAALYQKWIYEGLLRQKPLPPSADGRHVPLDPGEARRKSLTDERTGKPYISNFIRSSRYTAWSFLPKQLFFQFSKLANAYFLTIGILQMIPGLSTTGTYTVCIIIAFGSPEALLTRCRLLVL